MKITAIKNQVKNPDRASIFVDSKYSFSLTLDQLLEQKLKRHDELDEQRVKELKKLSDEGKQKIRALEWLMRRPHSIREFREYCFKKKIEKELMELWIDEFSTRKYLDDEAFAQWFAENRSRKNKSSRSIISELMAKGISADVAREIVGGLQDDRDSLAALVLKLQQRPRYKDDKKLIAHLLSKGFRYDDVKAVLTPER